MSPTWCGRVCSVETPSASPIIPSLCCLFFIAETEPKTQEREQGRYRQDSRRISEKPSVPLVTLENEGNAVIGGWMCKKIWTDSSPVHHMAKHSAIPPVYTVVYCVPGRLHASGEREGRSDSFFPTARCRKPKTGHETSSRHSWGEAGQQLKKS